MNSEKVSIIIPVYNVEPYLAECLNSAISQDHGNIEIIAIDDGSTDASRSILEAFRTRHDNITIKSIKNQGLSVARNTGLEIATGEYILFLDSDDFIEKHTVSTCLKAFREHQSDIVFFSAKIFFDGVDESTGKRFRGERALPLQNKSFSAQSFFNQSIKLGSYLVSACLYIYKRHAFGDIKFYPGILHEDNLFTTRLLLENQHAKMACISDKLYNRRVRPDSIMTQKKQEKHINGLLVVAEELLKLDLAKENSEAGLALNQFIKTTLTIALDACRQAYGNNFPYHARKRLIVLFAQTRFKHKKVKSIVLSAFPELCTIKQSMKKILLLERPYS
ncbi:glycosyltransferase family 2 protein [Azotobacter beijerinckii]|uniref:Glycosyltransferase involved in cell wall bisynthesis n=1 Tax=Azotobacter beijerinckii TaxID=170623 RepID=A0A1I4BN90_9GAMM|nr:glycosyltransferase family 2 protein [Azotobacter beijerinckii]SFB11018.1 Glycosyltransferase involved in cell wall bisynthesis [Azotobacter beijerinckii]SFK69657.1 Glycosyltransferase involved in cell wall bisynthesis [Azotobacter beijerinckii]